MQYPAKLNPSLHGITLMLGADLFEAALTLLRNCYGDATDLVRNSLSFWRSNSVGDLCEFCSKVEHDPEQSRRKENRRKQYKLLKPE